MSESLKTINLADFQVHVGNMLPAIKRQYDRGVNRDLSQQLWQGLFKRNITTVLQQVFQDGLSQLQQARFDHVSIIQAEGEGGINEQVLKPFQVLMDELMQYAVQKHRSSCALSNFPEEHNPSREYIAQVLEDVNQGWSAFASQVVAMMPR